MEYTQQSLTIRATPDHFTGEVWFDAVYRGAGSRRARANIGRFSPGSRTFWHRHVLGQRLYILSGVALIGGRDGRIIEAHPGETVDCDPGEDHWHGAAPDSFMEHLAVWEAGDSSTPETEWWEAVSEAEYHGPRIRGWEYEASTPGPAAP